MASSSSSQRCRYHAFLSFRGADTRKGFTDHLYRALDSAGIHTFRDDDEIERGAEIAAELERAIQESRVAIIVFSEGYASSSWCLDELAMIMERKRTDGYMVVPVFYKVDPSVVRWQRGSFSEAFAKHEERFKEETGKVDKWRKALKDVAGLGGMELGHRHEAELIQTIVKDIENKLLEPKVLNVAPHEVGIDDRVKDINMWLRDGSSDVGVAGIYGMGGIGKTTIAKAVYNMNSDRFEGSSFLADFRETSKQRKGLVHLQMKLLSDIQKKEPKKIYDVNDGMNQIKRFVSCKRVLIVLDDVDDSDQLSAIVGMREWFHPGSKIIITTRDLQLLKANDISELFKVRELDEKESLDLLSWHAFKRACPTESYMEVSKEVVQHCAGLPLAIKVLGSSLYRESVDVWKDQVKKLAMIPDRDVQDILKISYDGLKDDLDKRLFLHIACFFVGKQESFVVTVLDSLDFFPKRGIPNLVDKCLLEIGYGHWLTMHQLLIDMAWGIVRDESPENPGERSRLRDKDASNVLESLEDDMTGTKTVKGLLLNLPEENTYQADFKAEAFKGMKNLQLLLLNNVKVSGCYGDFPKKIAWLSWQGFLLQTLPKEFSLRNVVVLELQNSNLQLVWEGKKDLPNLKILDLSHSVGLVTTPDFSGFSNLERLILKGCTNIIEIDESIVDLGKLVLVDLEDCKNLKHLPETMERLTSLQTLNISGCSNLLSPRQSIESTGLPSVSLPHSLVDLRLGSCNITEITFDLSILSSLEALDLSGNPFIFLPENIRSLIVLRCLDISGCRDLIILPEIPPSLFELKARDCISLKEANLPNSLTYRLSAVIGGSEELVKVEGMYSIKPLSSEVDAEMIRKMGLYNLGSIERSGEYDMKNHLTWCEKKCPLQGLYEFGIFSIFLHGRKIPEWYNYRGETALSIIVPSHPAKLKIIALNVSVVYVRDVDAAIDLLVLKVSNEAKGVMWSYSPMSVGVPKQNEEMTWLSHWPFENDEFEGGQELRFSADVFSHNFILERNYAVKEGMIKELGVQFVYEHENDQGNASNGIQLSNPEEDDDVTDQHDEAPSSSQYIPSTGYVSDPKYQFFPGKYFLSNHSFTHPLAFLEISNIFMSEYSHAISYNVIELCEHLLFEQRVSEQNVKAISNNVIEMCEHIPFEQRVSGQNVRKVVVSEANCMITLLYLVMVLSLVNSLVSIIDFFLKVSSLD